MISKSAIRSVFSHKIRPKGSQEYLEGVSGTLLLQEPRLKDLPDEPLGIVNGVLWVSFGQFGGFVANQHRFGREWDATRETQPAFFVCDHLHLPAARVEDADRTEGGAQVQTDYSWFRRGQVLLPQVASQKQGQDSRTCGKWTPHSIPAGLSVKAYVTRKKAYCSTYQTLSFAPTSSDTGVKSQASRKLILLSFHEDDVCIWGLNGERKEVLRQRTKYTSTVHHPNACWVL